MVKNTQIIRMVENAFGLQRFFLVMYTQFAQGTCNDCQYSTDINFIVCIYFSESDSILLLNFKDFI